MTDQPASPSPGNEASESLVSKWRRGHGNLRPVVIDGDVTFAHVDEMLNLAFNFGLPNIFIKANRPVEAPSGGEFVPLSQRSMTVRDVEVIAGILWKTGNVITEMLQGKAIDLRYDLRRSDGAYLMFRGNMSKLDGVGTNNFNISLRSFATAPPAWEDLGIEPQITRNLLPDRGLFLWVGKTDSGKTTLQASAINYLGRKTRRALNCVEYGEPLEYPQSDRGNKRFRYMGYNLGVDLRAPTEWTRGLVAFACRHSVRNAPGLVAISECRDGAAFEGVTELALAGSPVMTTLHTSGPSDTINRMCQTVDAGVREAHASNLLAALRVIVHQRLIPSAHGGRVGMREFVVFTKEMKSEIQKHDVKTWAEVIDDIMHRPDPEHVQTFPQHLERLLSAGDITREIYDEAIEQVAVLE